MYSNIPHLKQKQPPCDATTAMASSPSGAEASTSSSPSKATTTATTTTTTTLTSLPFELQVNWLTYLRAYDLAYMQQTCRFYARRDLVHAIVVHASEQVYPPDLTEGFELQPLTCAAAFTSPSSPAPPPSPGVQANNSKVLPAKKKAVVKNRAASKPAPASPSPPSTVNSTASLASVPEVLTPTTPLSSSSPVSDKPNLYTFEHLRNMELLVVARVLSRPEPPTGYIVSKSWCKTALRWLEAQQEQRQQQQQQHASNSKKKLSKKKQRLRDRKFSDASPPWPNVNSDLLCTHNSLSTCSSSKSAKARRRVMDRQAWKIIKKLYPDSTQLESALGECLQCRAEAETARLTALQQATQEKLQRKQPLADPMVRRFYTRTRGVPEHCLVSTQQQQLDSRNQQDLKMPAMACPLIPGTYCVLPRSWCHGWRKYIKTGENVLSCSSSCSQSSSFPPPDAASLLCDAHRFALLPPHLEAYLAGESTQLLGSVVGGMSGGGDLWPEEVSTTRNPSFLAGMNPSGGTSSPVAPPARPSFIPGQAPDAAVLHSAGAMTDVDLARQLSALRSYEQEQAHRWSQNVAHGQPCAANTGGTASSAGSPAASKNEMLDRENFSTVEIVSLEEFTALEKLWPGTTVFSLRFTVHEASSTAAMTKKKDVVSYSTTLCRECDATGRQCNVIVKNRARGWIKRSADKARAPASLEY